MTPTQAALQECFGSGVREFCVCAGSRNASLVVELCRIMETPAAADLRMFHFFEERSAAFFALGRVRKTGRPAAVLTTSGTAAAELLPAMIEAHYQGLPLLALTADRPRRFRGSGAPQAIEQAGLFGPYASVAADVEAATETQDALSRWDRRSPAHLNVCLEEPDLAVGTAYPYQMAPRLLCTPSPGAEPTDSLRQFLASANDLLVIAGDLLPTEQTWARQLLSGLPTAPLWAEEASGLRQNPPGNLWLLRGGEASLRHLAVKQVLRIGGVPSCRFWRDLETRPEISVVSCTRSGHSGLARESCVLPLFFAPPAEPPKGHAFAGKDRDTRLDPADLLAEHPDSECAHLRHLSRLIPPDSTLFLGNSLAVREWNLCAQRSAGPWECHVLRGANGIDGNLSFFLGISANATESWAVVGDLTALYDLSGPWILPQLHAGRRRIVVIHNGGGKIFSRLPAMAALSPNERRIIENQHSIHLEPWARMWGLEYVRIDCAAHWAPIENPGTVLVEVRPDAAQSDAFWAAWAQLEREVWK